MSGEEIIAKHHGMSAKVCLDKEVDEWQEIPCDEEEDIIIVQVFVEDVTTHDSGNRRRHGIGSSTQDPL